MAADLQRTVDRIKTLFPDLEPTALPNGWVELRIPKERWLDVSRTLRDDSALAFDFLSNLCSVDWIEKGTFEVVAHLISIAKTGAQLVIKTEIPRDEPKVASLTSIWPTANWQEREAWDMMGIVFEGHPGLRRVLMKEHWEGHPLRKDYEDKRAPRERKTKENVAF